MNSIGLGCSTDNPSETPIDNPAPPIDNPTPPSSQDIDPNFLVRNFVQHRRGNVDFPTCMVVHLMGRVVNAADMQKKSRGVSEGTFAKFYMVTEHKSPDGVLFTQRHR